MKTIIRLIVAAVFFTSTMAAMAATQPDEPVKKEQRSRRINRTELATRQAKRMAEKLDLDQEKTDRLVATFLRSQQEIWASKPQRPSMKEEFTDAQADSAINARFDHAQRMLDLRRKYYAEYRKFLTPSQINKLYNMEGHMMHNLFMRRANQEKEKRAENRGKRHHKHERGQRAPRAAAQPD